MTPDPLGTTTEVLAPEFVTFTGLDQHTDTERLQEIGRRYPVEWGVLFSPKRAGREERYPVEGVVDRFRYAGLRLAAHLCGAAARTALLWPDTGDWEAQLADFARVQVNYAPTPDLHGELRPVEATGRPLGHWEAGRFADLVGRPVIVQSRSALRWPDSSGYSAVDRQYLHWLYDLSGGRGKAPAKWPPHPGGDALVGYAGGINAANAAAVVLAVASRGRYWLDMEGGVRDSTDRLDLDAVEAVCAAVYPEM